MAKKEKPQADEKLAREKNARHDSANREKKDQGRKERKPLSPDSLVHQILPIVLTALAALLGVCIYAPAVDMGILDKIVSWICFGLFGGGAYLIPALLLIHAITWRITARAQRLVRRLVFSATLIFVVSVLWYTFGMPAESAGAFGSFFGLGLKGVGGGIFGSFTGFLLDFLVKKVGTVIITVTVLIGLFIFAYGSACRRWLVRLFAFLRATFARIKEKRRQAAEARAEAETSRHAPHAQGETSFYDATSPQRPRFPAAGGGKTEEVTLMKRESDARRVVHRFYDLDAEEAAPPVPSPMKDGDPAHAPEKRPERKSFSDPTPEATPSAFGARKSDMTVPPVRSSTFDFSGDAEISIVSSRPIPPNRTKPFAGVKGEDTAKEKPELATEEPKTKKDAPSVLIDLEELEIEEPELEGAAVADAEEVSANPSAARVKKEKKGASASDEPTLVINKAHVVEHIGAETLASEEDINKYAKDTFFYSFPPLSLLHEDDAFNQEDSDIEIAAKADKLRETLNNFGVAAEITCVSRGPRLTRYELVPKPGVRISKIENLVDEITMNLEAISVRIEAPIPGKAAIGVEVPNINTTTVRLRGLLDTDTFRDAPGKTTVCLGVDVVGKPVFADLDKMPHLLVAGATGMGKSVCINSLLISLLYKARPDEVKLILIDPKKVEFQSYANIPHLLVPVVTEPQKAAGALSWAVGEMERRYDLIESAAVRNIVAYNKTVDDHPGRVKMPQIVIVIDELHDLMLQARDAVEDSIARIAAKARAAGILLIIGTQRPSVNVITGVIKANIPSRIAFHVASQVDSRTILDAVGAEKLLNNGDMLFLSPGMKMMTPKRVQGAFLDDDEVNRVADYLRKNSSAVQYDESVMADMERESEKCNKDKKQGADFGGEGSAADSGEDDIFYKAVEVALESGKISTSLLQRRLSVGFGKAARMIDRMCDLGIVSPPNGQKPREVLITMDEYRQMRLRGDE